MQETLDFAAEFIRSYGFRAAAIVLATVLAVELIKIPIVRVAKTHAAKTGTDKSTVTRFVLLLPPVVAFALTLLMRLVETGFDVTAVDFSAVAADAVVYATMSVGVYESVKKQLEAYAAAKNVTSLGKNVEQPLENLTQGDGNEGEQGEHLAQETSEHLTPGDKSGAEQGETASGDNSGKEQGETTEKETDELATTEEKNNLPLLPEAVNVFAGTAENATDELATTGFSVGATDRNTLSSVVSKSISFADKTCNFAGEVREEETGEEQSKTAPEANIDPIKTSINEFVPQGQYLRVA